MIKSDNNIWEHRESFHSGWMTWICFFMVTSQWRKWCSRILNGWKSKRKTARCLPSVYSTCLKRIPAPSAWSQSRQRGFSPRPPSWKHHGKGGCWPDQRHWDERTQSEWPYSTRTSEINTYRHVTLNCCVDKTEANVKMLGSFTIYRIWYKMCWVFLTSNPPDINQTSVWLCG